jgi:O-Antigen ligase
MGTGLAKKTNTNPSGFDVLVGSVIASAVFYAVVLGDANNNNWRRHPVLALVDVLLIVLVSSATVSSVRRRSRSPRMWWNQTSSIERSLGALFIALTASAILHPSAMGAVAILRVAGMIVLALTIGRSQVSLQRILTYALVATTVFEALVVVAQRVLGHAVGLGAIGELVVPFNGDPSTGAPSGTLFYPYPLAGWGLLTLSWCVVMRSRLSLSSSMCAAVGVSAGIMVGMSQGLAGLIGACALLVFSVMFLWTEANGETSSARARLLLPIVGCVFALGLGVAISPSGWADKADRSTKGVEAAGNGRVGMLNEAVAMTKKWPLFGVGPGNFMATRDAHRDIAALASEDQPVHNVPLLILAEGGGFAGVALLSLVVAVVVGPLRRHPLATLSAIGGLSGFLMFDLYLWWFGIGVVQLGVMFGLLMLIDSKAERLDAAPAGVSTEARFGPAEHVAST